MAYTPNQISDKFQSDVGRAPTPFELQKYSNASIQDLANLKTSFSRLNPDLSIVDYLTHQGLDSSMKARNEIASKYGITGYTGSYDQNVNLLKSLKSGAPSTPSVPGKIETQNKPTGTTPETPTITPAQPSITGTIADASKIQPPQPTTDTQTTIPEVQTTKDNYVQTQKAVLDVTKRIDDINKSIDSAMQNKRNEISRSGGVVDESQLRSLVLAESQPLLAERKDLLSQRSQLVGEQNIAGKAYQDALNAEKQSRADSFKQQQLDLNKDKVTIQQQQFEEKLASANIVKKAVYEDGTKVGETFVDKTTGKKVNINTQTGEKVGTGTSINDGNISSGVSGASGITKGKISYTDFSKVPDAPTDENRNTIYPGTGGKTYGAIYEDAVAFAQTGKYQKMGMSSKPSAKAYDNAVKAKASNIAASLGMTEQDLRTSYKANSAAVGKLITQKATVSAFENKAKAQIDMILNGYKDPVSGKQVPSLNDSVPRSDTTLVNKFFVAGKILAGNTKAQLLSNALVTFSTEYAKIMSGSTGSAAASSDSARAEAAGLISTALSNGTLKETLGLLQKEMDTTIKGYDDSIKATLGAASVGPKQQDFNPKGSMSDKDFVEKTLTSHGQKYDDIIAKYKPTLQPGEQLALDNETGDIIAVTSADDKSKYTPL